MLGFFIKKNDEKKCCNIVKINFYKKLNYYVWRFLDVKNWEIKYCVIICVFDFINLLVNYGLGY